MFSRGKSSIAWAKDLGEIGLVSEDMMNTGYTVVPDNDDGTRRGYDEKRWMMYDSLMKEWHIISEKGISTLGYSNIGIAYCAWTNDRSFSPDDVHRL